MLAVHLASEGSPPIHGGLLINVECDGRFARQDRVKLEADAKPEDDAKNMQMGAASDPA